MKILPGPFRKLIFQSGHPPVVEKSGEKKKSHALAVPNYEQISPQQHLGGRRDCRQWQRPHLPTPFHACVGVDTMRSLGVGIGQRQGMIVEGHARSRAGATNNTSKFHPILFIVMLRLAQNFPKILWKKVIGLICNHFRATRLPPLLSMHIIPVHGIRIELTSTKLIPCIV